MALENSTGRENRTTERVILDTPLKVIMGSIGSDMRYELATKNLSINGFFLEFDKPGRFPFTPSSIMEVWLELEPGVTIFFNGKMARVVYPGDSKDHDGPGIAIKIVQVDQENEKKLEDFIESKALESQEEGSN